MNIHQFLFNARHARTSEAPIETIAEDTSEGQQVTLTELHLPFEAELPSLSGATAWLNSPPLSAADLRGNVVLIDFWTYTCINWLRTLPYVRAWAEKYQEHGVVVIGVHSPEFSFEHDLPEDAHCRKLAILHSSFPFAQCLVPAQSLAQKRE
jgi:thiol-disulfide isomerase/thioredoxin